MKTTSTISVRMFASGALIVLLAALALFSTPLAARAQGDNVTVSAADFQRLVYSAHLHTQLALKPELEACLQVLLELQRRNPQANSLALAGVSSNALQRYRASAPAYIRTGGFRDEILAAYLDAFRQVPARTNFIPINLTMLSSFTLGPADYNANVPPAQLIRSLVDAGRRRLFAPESETLKRKALVDDCVGRARGSTVFAAGMDGLLLPETGVSLWATPAQMIGNTNSPLHDSPTLTNLLALSQGSGNGSLTVSSNQLRTLFAAEMQTVWDTIHTNLAVLAQVNQSQPDLLAYLTNQAAIDANVQLWTAVQQNQPAKLACATAAILFQSDLLPVDTQSAEIEGAISAVGNIAFGIAGLCKGDPEIGGLGGILSGGLDIFNMLTGAQSAQDVMATEIQNIQTTIDDLSYNMNYRFDRLDQSLTTIFNTMNQEFTNITFTLDAQGRQIAHLNGSVDNIRSSLVNVQAQLDRLESTLFNDFNEAQRQDLVTEMNGVLFYEIQNPYAGPMTLAAYSAVPDGPENIFYTYATSLAHNSLSSPTYSGSLPPLASQLAGWPLDANLNYIKEFLSANLGQPTLGTESLANPRDWFDATYAYLQLATEHPMLFREKGPRLNAISDAGTNLTDFLASLTFSGANINWNLYAALQNYYLTRLSSFNDQIAAFETTFATNNSFALGTWRRWEEGAPGARRAAATQVLGAPENPQQFFPRDAARSLAAGEYDSLALKTDGTVVGWGDNAHGQVTIPAGLTNVAAIAAGGSFCLALKADSTVIGWGDNTWSQTNVPAGLTNVNAIAAGADYSLALKADGTVFGWGLDSHGEATGVPRGSPPFNSQGAVTVGGQMLSNVLAVAAGQAHSLALLRDGTVFGWGLNSLGEATGVPSTLIPPLGSALASIAGQTVSNVAKIAAGSHFSLALKTNGTVVGWGDNSAGQTDVPAGLTNVTAIAAGDVFGLALKADGTIVTWGGNSYGQTNVPPGLTNVVAITAGSAHSLALKADGTVVAWGRISELQCLVPPAFTWRSAIAAGYNHNLALAADGTVVAWGDNTQGQLDVPGDLTNAVAVAAGGFHSLALKGDGTVAGWGYNSAGESSIPLGLTNVVAIAAGYAHSLALKANGTVTGWGENYYGQTNTAGLSNVVAIAAGFGFSLALKADGAIVAWGNNAWGDTNVPAGLTKVSGIAAGIAHALALKSDGTVVAWGDDSYLETNVPAGLSSVMAIAGGNEQSLALKRDGTVVAWGNSSSGKTNLPPGLSNVVAIAAGGIFSLAVQADGRLFVWGDNSGSQASIPAGLTNVVALSGGVSHTLALKADGTVIGWGDNAFGETAVPAGLSNVVAIAAGGEHSLALKADGTVSGWGDNGYGETDLAGSSNVVAIAAGVSHSLALNADGTVIGRGNNSAGQATVPFHLNNVVAIAAGDRHSVALEASGVVVAWGENGSGQTSVPPGLSGVVAIAAGGNRSMALKADGTLVGWGENASGESTPPAGATNVVSVAVGRLHSLALKADGTVVGWGYDLFGAADTAGLSNVVAVAAGNGYSVFLTTTTSGGAPQNEGLSLVLAPIPARVVSLFLSCNQDTIHELGFTGSSLDTAAAELTGSKMLLASVLELGMPYTLAQDGILHGFLYGSESLTDTSIATNFLQNQNASLRNSPNAPARGLVEWDWQSYLRFHDRLNLCLTNLQATGQPEIPRLVGHTLRLLNLLRDAYMQPTNSPPPTLEVGSVSTPPSLLLYGEPYMRYTLQFSDTLGGAGWATSSTLTGLRDGQTFSPPVSGSPQRFYRLALPMP